MTPEIRKFKNPADFTSAAVGFIAGICQEKKGVCRVALSGGVTPEPVYKALAKSGCPFPRMEIFEVDERKVPANHPYSNRHMIEEALIKPIGDRLGGFHYFDTTLPISESLEKYARQLPVDAFDLVVLGIGPDGHIASLFPFSPALSITQTAVAHTVTDDFQIRDRLTLTFPPILAGKALLVLLKGKDKAPILKKLITFSQATSQQTPEETTSFPAIKLLTHPNLHIYFGDF